MKFTMVLSLQNEIEQKNTLLYIYTHIRIIGGGSRRLHRFRID